MDHDEAIIRTRLSVNERPLRRLTGRFYKWAGSLNKGTQEEIDNGLQAILLEIAQFELGLSKSKLVAEMAERERFHYDQEQRQIEENIVQSQEELEVLAKDLEVAKQERANKIQYDEMAAEVAKFPSRESSQNSIATLNAEIRELQEEGIRQAQVMELRKNQFYTALTSLQRIQESILEEQQEEERKLFLKRRREDDIPEDDDDDIPFENMDGVVDGAVGAAGTAATEAVVEPTAKTPKLNEDGEAMMVEGEGEGEGGISASASPALSGASHTPRHSGSDHHRRTPVDISGAATPNLGGEDPTFATPPSRSLTGTPTLPETSSMHLDP